MNRESERRAGTNGSFLFNVIRPEFFETWSGFSTRSVIIPDERVGDVTFADYEEAYRSVINFGIRQLYGRLAPDVEEIEKQLFDALIIFEPRINRRTLRVKVTIERNILSIELTGELWVNPLPEKLFIKTELDLESSAMQYQRGRQWMNAC